MSKDVPRALQRLSDDKKVWVFWWSKRNLFDVTKHCFYIYFVFMETIANLKKTFGMKTQGWICTKLLDVSCTYACWVVRKWNAAPLFLTSHGPAFAPSVLQAAHRLVFVSCAKQMFAENCVQENRQDLMYFTATIDRTAASIGFTWQGVTHELQMGGTWRLRWDPCGSWQPTFLDEITHSRKHVKQKLTRRSPSNDLQKRRNNKNNNNSSLSTY